ncbi:MAG: afsK 2 [Marmoricola sp.]|nr:afsK 2 [Marmoricola sp.]
MGRYRLITVIGEGGMGVVHLAEAEDGHRVALKVLRPHIVGDHEARERLAREVGSLSRITSPRVAEIVDADPYGDVPFVATRYVPGLSLHQHVQEYGPLSDVDLVILAEGLADALLAVHRVGVLHRDIKPSNVLMEGRAPVLIDFGLARLAEDPRLTQTGWLLGTPGYLAPEVLYGDDASPASDVHSLAATVVFAATGQAPYGRGPAMAIMDRVRRGEHDLTGVPDSLVPLLESCLAPDPLDRPSLVDLHRTLRGQLDALGTSGPRPAPAPANDQWTVPVAVAHARDIHEIRIAPTVVQPVTPPTRLLDRTSLESNAFNTHVDIAPTPVEPGQDQPFHAPVAIAERRGKQRLITLGFGVLATAMVAASPYLGAAVVIAVVVLLRLASVTSQRHSRRQELRGRARWYDVPASTIFTPGYLLLSLAGTILLVGWAAAAAAATAILMAVGKAPIAGGAVAVGVAFALAIWWGPGSARVREMSRKTTRRLSGDSSAGWVVLAGSVLVAIVLFAWVGANGPNWAPQTSTPWNANFANRLHNVF